MDKRTDIDTEVKNVEYVEAEVIEPSHPQAYSEQVPYVRSYSSSGCFPCCGPFGCLATLLVAAYMLYEYDFLQAVAIALILFVVVSFVASSFTRASR